MNYLYLDLETRSEVDVTEVGSAAYGEHHSTCVLCAAVAVDDQPVKVIEGDAPGGELSPAKLALFVETLRSYVARGHVLVAHNVGFERSVLHLEDVPWLDTAALARRMGLPGKLEDLSKFFWPDDPAFQKDMEGNRVMMQLTKSRRPSAENPDPYWTPRTAPEKFQKLYSYCARDVDVMREAHRRLLPLEPFEQAVWECTERMNLRGVKVDEASIPLAQEHLEEHSAPLLAEFEQLVGCSPKSYKAVADALGMESVAKDKVRDALKHPEKLTERQRRALELMTILAKSSTAKLEAMRLRATKDGRVHGAMMYAGAERTSRWSSSGVQLQNFVQGFGEQTGLAFEALHSGVVSEMFLGMPQPKPKPPLDQLGIIAQMLRGFLVGPFFVGDFAQIECRVLNWLAGEESMLELFRTKGDPYCRTASAIYGEPVTKKDKDRRQMGKWAELGCGYGIGGVGLMNQLDKQNDVQIEEAFAQKIVKAYRRTHPAVVAWWYRLEAGLRFAIQQKSQRIEVKTPTSVPVYMGVLEHGGVEYAFIELPNGRKLYYAQPEVNPKGEIRYFGRDLRNGGAWGRTPTYSGKISENLSQALSRDILAAAMLRLEKAGFPLVFSVHDEVVSEVVDGLTEKQYQEVLEEVPAWCRGLPLAAEVFTTERYRK